MSAHQGSCHCGHITLILDDQPSEAIECNCSICRRTAALWHYCAPDLLRVTGDCDGYQQGDRALDLWHCPTCSCTTHWTPTDPAYPRVGVNLRMFDPELWNSLPRKLVDGASF